MQKNVFAAGAPPQTLLEEFAALPQISLLDSGGRERWQKYSGLVFCKSRGNSGVTVSTSHHLKPQESSL